MPIPTDGTLDVFRGRRGGPLLLSPRIAEHDEHRDERDVSFLREGDTPVQRVYNLPALTRVTVSAADVPELAEHVVRHHPLDRARRRRRAHHGLGRRRRDGGRAHRQGDRLSVADLVSGGRQRRLLRYVRAAGQSAGLADQRDGGLPARRWAGGVAQLHAAGARTAVGLRERDPRAGDAFVRHDGPRRQADPVRARDVLQERRHDVPRRPLVGGRALGIDALVPGGRADGRLLRDVRAARESESGAGGCDDPLSDQQRRGARRSADAGADQPHDDRRGLDSRDRGDRRLVRHRGDRADHRRALDVLGTVVRRAQQHGRHRPRHVLGARRRRSRRSVRREFVHPARQSGQRGRRRHADVLS